MMKKCKRKYPWWFFTLLLGLLCSSNLIAQQATLSGLVTDKSGEPLAGTTVIIKGTTSGTMTDTNGNYELQASITPNSVLVISYVGYLTQEVVIGNRTLINVELEEDVSILGEVIVTGYQTERKADLTGAVSVVKMDDIISNPTGNIISTLAGRLPGVTISTDGTPGGVNADALIRGVTTINSTGPLYVIDGVQTRSGIATLLNANDVESIQVLKDAASASIYGVQAANGVIIITTKKAAKGQLDVDFDVQYTASTFHTGIKMLNAQQWGESYWTAYLNDGVKPSHDLYGNGPAPVIPAFIDDEETIPAGDTYWADEVYKTSLLQNYNLTLTRGGESGSSILSFNYFDEDGLIKYTKFTRFNVRYGSSYSFLKNKLRIGENLNVSNWNTINKPGGIEELTIAQHPIIPVYDMNGGYAGPTQGIGDKPNPIRLLDQVKTNRNNYMRLFGNLYAEIEPIKNLILRSNVGINYQNSMSTSFEPRWKEGDRRVDKNALNSNSSMSRDWVFSNTLTYNIKINTHAINALVGTEAKQTMGESMGGRREEFLIEAIDYRYLSSGDGAQTNSGSGSLSTIYSMFGKVNYSWMDRYLFSATLRRDASSVFGKNNRAGIFPAGSIGWRISKEDFMSSIPAISDLKLRVSWGQNGNDQISNEATYTLYGTNLITGGYDINGSNQGVISGGLVRTRTGNPNIKWEVTTQTNYGVDLALFENRLSLTADYFIKKTDDMLITLPYLAIIGEGGNMNSNGASMENKGFEVLVSWMDDLDFGLHYEISLTGAVYKNVITYLPPDIYYTWGGGNGIDMSIVGQPYGSWFGYVADGLFRTQEDLESGVRQAGYGLGRVRYVDLNGDKIINTLDRKWLGSDNPKFDGGLNVAVAYKSFDMSFYLRGLVRDAWNNSKFYTDFFQLWTGNHGTRLLGAWNSNENFDSDIPALTALNTNNEDRGSTYYIEDGSFMKLKNLVIGYTLPKGVLDRLNIRSMRLYLQGQDLFTLTKYTGADPEVLGYNYPLPRSYTFGLSLGF